MFDIREKYYSSLDNCNVLKKITAVGNIDLNLECLEAPSGAGAAVTTLLKRSLSPILSIALFCIGDWAQLQPRTKQSSSHRLIYPNGLALDKTGDLFISDIGAHRIFRLDRRGRLTVVGGGGEGGYGGDNGPATQARLFGPHDMTIDPNGSLIIADTYNHRIRRIDRSGFITTIAGNGKAGYQGDGGPATLASLNNPQSVAFDHHGNLLIGDTYNHVIRAVDQKGVITTIAGSVPGYGGDGGPATKAQINLTMAVAVAPDGSVYISDAANSRIRRVGADGVIQTVAGYGPAQDAYGAGFAGDGGPLAKARLFSVTDMKFDSAGNFFISDSGNHRIRSVRNGVISTVAGLGEPGFSGDKGKPLEARLNTPQKIALGRDGAIYFTDRANRRVRKIDPSGVIITVAGSGKPAEMIFDPEVIR